MKQNDNFLKRAIEFHGHLGPYLVLGLKAGNYANEILGKSPFEMKVIIETIPSPPQSCFADGIQFSTGCTYGKRNITIVRGKGLRVRLKKKGKKLTLILKKEIMDKIKSLLSDKKLLEKLAFELYSKNIGELFDIK
ncbi:formylmethanofuran dehydrogenase subunit E family protein [SCandidatus Aminicenantes bacterium Aminicenantia_JdfR_composite]|nr:formylmethanofuran dehydrogenase subunit E family protein [SCandidatus Aminicenantes bacterium Aminicenantia_JdfR_composite]